MGCITGAIKIKFQRSFSIAKITKPRLPEIVHRHNLYQLLDERRDYPGIWITGAAGSGKTTLVSGYIECRGLPWLWYQIDRGDRDIATFFHYMGLAASRISGQPPSSFPHFSIDYTSSVSVFALRFFEILFNCLGKNCAIVLDNYQEAGKDTLLHEVVCRAVSALPAGINIFIISRTPPHRRFSRLKANRMLTSIGRDHIRLKKRETEAISRFYGKKRLTDNMIRAIHAAAKGWVAGVVLIMSRLNNEPGELKKISRHAASEVFDYLSTEIFENIDPVTKRFLCKTALFPHMTPDMARSLTGLVHSEQVFSSLFRNNLFIEMRRKIPTYYQYHPLFREFLLTRLSRIYGDDEVQQLQYNAAMILEKNGQVDAAVALLLDSKSWEKAAGLITRHADSILLQGRIHTLNEWLNRFPGPFLDEAPWLIYWQGMCRLPLDPACAGLCFQKAFHFFQGQNDRPGLFLSWAGIVESVFYGFENFAALGHWIRILEGLLKENPAYPSEKIEARVVIGMFSAMLFHQPHHPQISLWSDRAWNLARQTTDTRAKAYAYTQLVFYHMMMGYHDKGLSVVEEMGGLKKANAKDPFVVINDYSVQACYYLNIQDFEQCLKVSGKALDHSWACGIHVMDLMYSGWGAWSSLAANDIKTASKLIKRMKTNPILNPHEKSFYLFLKALESLHSNDFESAVRHSGESLDILEQISIPFDIGFVHMAKSRALFGLGKTGRARRNLIRALEIGEKTQSVMMRFNALLLLATQELMLNGDQPDSAYLRQGMSLGNENQFHAAVMVEDSDLANLCSKALEEEIEIDYVNQLIKKRKLRPNNPEAVSPKWPWPVRIYTLGGFFLEINGEKKPFSQRPPRKPLALLKALIAMDGRFISETHIQDTLWPDLDGDRAHNVFSTTLFRLRKLLGCKNAVTLSQGGLRLEPDVCWVDARYFENLLDRADTACKKGVAGIEKAMELMAGAADLYKGEFLPQDEASWLIPARQRLNAEFAKRLEELIHYHEKSGRAELAAHYKKKGGKLNLN